MTDLITQLKRLHTLYGAAGGHHDLCYWLDQAIRELEAGGSMTNEEFIRRLKRARRLALTGYKNEFRIGCACAEAGVIWRSPIREPNATISSDPIEYLNTHGNTEANVRAVFDNSIKALGGKP